jgi:hypothetical protein
MSANPKVIPIRAESTHNPSALLNEFGYIHSLCFSAERILEECRVTEETRPIIEAVNDLLSLALERSESFKEKLEAFTL